MEQQTPEWFAAKRSVLSASDMRHVLAKKGGKGRRGYALKIVQDLEGIPDFADEDTPPWFVDGKYYESFARGWYSWERKVDVAQVGFVVHDDYSFIGCSPDGLVGHDGLVEIKYRKYHRTFEQHTDTRGISKALKSQVQTQLLVTGRAWCDYVNYWRDDENDIEEGHILRLPRDDEYINEVILPACITFWNEINVYVAERRASPL